MITDDLFESCPHCGGRLFESQALAEKKDACYYKVKRTAKVWPSAYASGRLVQCRKKGAANWGNKSEGVAEGSLNEFAPGSGAGNGPFDYGMALKEMAKLYAKGEFDIELGASSKEQNESDAEDIDQTADAFLNQGMEAGRERYKMCDDTIQDDMDAYLADQGFNVQNDIHAEYQKDVERHSNSPQGRAQAQAQAEKDAEWERGATERQANKVVVFAVDAKTGEKEFSSISFDQRRVPPGQLRAQIEKSIADLKQHFVKYPGRDPSEKIIKVTIGGKPVDLDQGVAEGKKKSDRYHIVGKDGKPANLASYADRASAIKDRDEKYPGAVVQQVGPRGKVKGVAEDAALAEEFDLIENIINNLADYNNVDAEVIWEDLESLTDDELYAFAVTTPIMEDWQKVNKRDRTDGMSRKAVNAYRRENPGSKLKTAVTTKPSKLKRGSKASKRRSSYCSRSRGQMKMHSISCAKTPDKAICKARRRWNCESVDFSLAEATGDAKFDAMMANIVKGAAARKDIDTLRAQPTKSSPEAALAKFGMELIGQLEKLCRARCGPNRTMQDKSDIQPVLAQWNQQADGGARVAQMIANNFKIPPSNIKEFARAFNEHGNWPWQEFATAWTQGEWADYKQQWMDYIGSLGKGMTESDTGDTPIEFMTAQELADYLNMPVDQVKRDIAGAREMAQDRTRDTMGESMADDMLKIAQKINPGARLRGTPEQERERDQEIKAQREQEQQAYRQSIIQADIEKLPELEAQYQEMEQLYNSLGGSNWQYADSEQNLSSSERRARAMEPQMQQLFRRIQMAKQAQNIAEGNVEATAADPVVVILDPAGKHLDKMALSAAAQKYRLGTPDAIKKQLAHQDYTKIGQYTIQAPMTGQPAEPAMAESLDRILKLSGLRS